MGPFPVSTVHFTGHFGAHRLKSNRNSAVKTGCNSVILSEPGQCARITKEMVAAMKASQR